MKKNMFGRFIGTLCVLLLAGTSCHVVDESSGGGTSRPSSSDISSSIPQSSVEENYNNLPVLTEGVIETITASDLDSISIDAYFFKNGESYRSLTVEYGVSVNTEGIVLHTRVAADPRQSNRRNIASPKMTTACLSSKATRPISSPIRRKSAHIPLKSMLISYPLIPVTTRF